MIKYLFVAINSIALFLYSFFFDGGVSITGNIPGNIKPGTEVTAEVVIKKGSLGGFAKLQIEVPEGITIKDSDGKGGSFTYASGIGKWIWTSIPSDAEFTVKFILRADPSLSGNKTINAKYSYVENNNKQVVEMQPVEVIVGDGSTSVASSETKAPENTGGQQSGNNQQTSNASNASNTSNTSSTTAPPTGNQEPNSNVSAARTITKAGPGEWNVDIKIKKADIKGFARYSDNLPAGFTAKAGKTAGSSFSVADNKVKFVWINVPTTEDIEISYVLSGSAQADTQLEGEFSYLENNESKSAKVAAEKLPGASDVAATTPTETPVSNNTPTETAVANNNNSGNSSGNTTGNNTGETTTGGNEAKTSGGESGTGSRNNGNVSYCVQIGAYTNSNVTNTLLARKHGISEPIHSEMADGFTKFMVGKFDEYKSARNHRESIKGKGVNGAFVAAYNGPKRITVQEALMVTSQKWYR